MNSLIRRAAASKGEKIICGEKSAVEWCHDNIDGVVGSSLFVIY